MKILSKYNINDELDLFNKLKRIKRNSWEFIVDGEWSEFPIHRGRLGFYYAFSLDEKYLYILKSAWNEEIVAVASDTRDFEQNKEKILGTILNRVLRDRGPYIDTIYSVSDIDENKFKKYYYSD